MYLQERYKCLVLLLKKLIIKLRIIKLIIKLRIIKEADKGSGIVVWDREDYLAEARTQLKDKDVYQELKGNIEGPLEKIIKSVLRKVRDRKDISDETLDYFLVNNPKLGKFYLLPKIHKRLYNVPGRPVISNSGYYTENISAFLEYHLKPISNHILRTPMIFYAN